MASSSNEADWLDVTMPTQELKRLRVHDTQPTDTTPLHKTMKENAEQLLNDHPKSPIFRADYNHCSGSLSDVYEQSYPTHLRQEFTCFNCRKFMRLFGDLALVDEHTGALLPLFWSPQHHVDPFLGPVSAVAKLFVGRKVIKEFQVTKSNQHAGIGECGGWSHMSFDFLSTRLVPNDLPGLSPASTPVLAAMLTQVLRDYDLQTVRRVSQLLLENKLSYADSYKASIRWTVGLKENQGTFEAADDIARTNLLSHTAASSFLGCLKQLRSGAVGTLLSNVKDKKSFKEIQESWNQLTNPVRYLRPTAAPAAGNVAVAERLFESLGLSKEDMRREYLRPVAIPEAVHLYLDRQYDSLPTPKEGVFGHIVPKNALKKQPERDGVSRIISNRDPPTTISFTTFAKKVLPTAKKLEYQLSSQEDLYFFITGLLDTKPLMQWHDDTNRVSWYTKSAKRYVKDVGLSSGWTPVPYIIPFPHLWDAPAATNFPLSEDPAAFKYYHSKQGFRYLIGLEGIKETHSTGLCLFPTLLKSEFHGVRSTIERYSNMGTVETAGSWVGGVQIDKSRADKHVFRVMYEDGQEGTYEIVLFK